MKRLALTAISVLTLTFIATAQPQTGWATLDTSFYSIQYPEDWELDQDGEMGASFFLFSPMESEEDQFMENINLVTEDLTGLNVDLDMYSELANEQIASAIENFDLQRSERIDKGGREYERLVYTGTLESLKLTFEQRFFIANETAYVITFSSETDQYEKYEDLSRKILDTFVVK